MSLNKSKAINIADMLERYAEAQPILFSAGIVTDKQKGNVTGRVCGKIW